MRKLLLSAAVLAVSFAQAQTTLFSDNFNSGGANWTFGGTGSNPWIVNNSYTGSVFTSTPTQPGAITGGPQSNYLHIHNPTMCGGFGECQAIFFASSGGNMTATMVNNINTTGYTNVAFNFYYLCVGDVNTYGVVEYSTNNGANWSSASPNYSGVSSWTAGALTNPAFDNQAQLKFRFRWNESTSGNDPAFSVDEVSIVGTAGAAPTVTTGTALTPTNWCFNTAQNISVDFTSTGTFTAGNTYTAQLSDASGSFAAPTAIGTLSSTANSGTINATVPAGTAVGSGYRIRVVSSTPATTGSDNGVNFTIHALPSVNLGAFSAVCQNDAPFTLTGGSPAGGTFSGTGVTANVFNPSSAGAGSHTITYSYTDGNSCSASAQQPITVNSCASLEELDEVFGLYPNPATEFFKLQTELAVEKIELVDLNGKLLKTYPLSEIYELGDVTSGTYIVIIYTENGNYNKRLTVK